MKRIAFSIALLAVASFMVSCQKDGVYSPKNKVSKIYYEYRNVENGRVDSQQKRLKEVWNWEDDKLTSVNYMSNDGSSIIYTDTYTYDGNRIASVSRSYEGSSEIISNQIFKYDGNDLTEVANFWYDRLVSTYTFIHKSGKITQMDVTYPEGGKSGYDQAMPEVLRMMFPDPLTADMVERYLEHAAKSDMVKSMSYVFTYKGSNVSKMEVLNIMTEIDDGIEYVSTGSSTEEFMYGNKSNPYYGLITDVSASSLSKNNVTKASVTTRYTETEAGELVMETNYPKPQVTTYTYTYDGSKATMQSGTYEWTEGSYSNSQTTTYYYEY